MFVEKFCYFWEIKNPQYCVQPQETFIESPKFRVPQFRNSEWYLRLHLEGRSERSKERTSCFMYRGQDDGPEEVKIKSTLRWSLGKKARSTNHSFEKDSTGWGFTNFLPKILNSYEESFVIIWEMQCEFDSLETSREMNSFDENGVPFPVNCFTQTIFLFETEPFEVPIDSLINGSCPQITIPLILKEKYPFLSVILKSNSWDRNNLNAHLVNETFRGTFLVIGEINITNAVGQSLHSFKDQHTFREGGDRNWRLTMSIAKSRLKPYLIDSSMDQVLLKGGLRISIGETLSEVLTVECMKIARDFCDNGCKLYDDIYNLYKEQKLCDFTLKVGDKALGVHKVVIAAASPVFAAMVTNEMAEKENNVVDIVDVDMETVEDMVSFMYTGSLKEQEFESLKKLFIAGDKYGISSLVDLVRNTLITQIDSNTICDILYVADTHNDGKLSKEAMKFFNLNKAVLLNSSRWKAFAEEHANLAIKCLTEVCLLNKRKRED